MTTNDSICDHNATTRFDLIAPFFKQLHLVKKVSEDKMFISVTFGFSHKISQLKFMSYVALKKYVLVVELYYFLSSLSFAIKIIN